jgi:hypothetical protein
MVDGMDRRVRHEGSAQVHRLSWHRIVCPLDPHRTSGDLRRRSEAFGTVLGTNGPTPRRREEQGLGEELE